MHRKKILIITSRFPFPLEKGDKLRIYHQIKYLSKYHNIHLVSLNTENEIPEYSINELNKYCDEVHIINISRLTQALNIIKSFFKKEPLQVGFFYSRTAHKKIKNIIKKTKPKWCYAQLIRTAKYVQSENNNIIDYMDAFSKGIERRINKFPFIIRPLIKREYEITKKYESNIFSKFKHHTIITENDRKYIKHSNHKKIKIIPNGVDTNYFKSKSVQLKKFDIVFVGNMSYPPNIEAAIYICKKILPIIQKTYPACKVLIGGANPHENVKNLESKNVSISGWVKDIREVYASGKIFVAPMFIGTGLQNKLLEAMAMGVPCVTTKLANKALLANPSQIIIASNEFEFANACVSILSNKDLAYKLQKEALKFIKEKYEWNSINNKLNLLFKS